MRTETSGQHTRTTFDSFGEFLAYNETATDYRSGSMARSWAGGVDSIAGLVKLARDGMAREGIEALALSENNVRDMERELVSQQFQSFYSVEGGDVDIARYLDGEPECMINYYQDERQNNERIVTLVVAINVPSLVSPEAITRHGQKLMALAEAIESTGLQTEIWADSTIGNSSYNTKYTGRMSIKLKSPGELFDAGMFMFALTHPGMLRGLVLNTMHAYPAEFRRHLGIAVGKGYGSNSADFINRHKDDYPDGAILIPAIMRDSDVGVSIKGTLKALGLIND